MGASDPQPVQTETEPTPVGVFVGFLGSGKTTTLNRLLRGVHGKKIAVIVNEFGAVDVDSRLVAREVHADAELISLPNACICCKLRGDLLKTVKLLTDRFDLDYILVESTGLGEAAPIAQTFFAEGLGGKVRLDAVITVVDAAHFWDTYEKEGEGRIGGEDEGHGLAHLLAGQIEFADVVLLNKTDLVSDAETARLESFIWELNGRAKVIRTRFGDVDPAELLYTAAFDLDDVQDSVAWQEAEEQLEHDVVGGSSLAGHDLTQAHADDEDDEDHAEHDHADHAEDDSFGFTSFVYETAQPLDLTRLRATVVDRWGSVATGVVRSKGVVYVAGSDTVLQWDHAGRRCAWDSLGTWAPDSERRTQLVFIGREMDEAGIGRALDACAVDPATVVAGGVPPIEGRLELVLPAS